MNRSQLAFLRSDVQDPSAALAAASEDELEKLIDALYRNLDTQEPEFEAQLWFDLATEELERRRKTATDGWIA
jgi:hypothetical protein